MSASEQAIIDQTIHWLEKAVIGLNLCPFAKSVHIKKQIRYVVSPATEPEALLEQLIDELCLLDQAEPKMLDTTLLIHPQVLTDFLDYNDFLDVADHALVKLELDGILQIASFHPDYQFADAGPNDISNYTNRAPYPILHLLREDSIERAVQAFPDATDIYENNIKTLNHLGLAGWEKLMSSKD
ncbi:DUF1415 domain-containing protein [Ampullimonas aquatilis]|uniref:DUF1415 domain-containing protein n=1 Tax=Ampullimonas aquatilis TaxID=1341549 RepID=UPI003C75D7A7